MNRLIFCHVVMLIYHADLSGFAAKLNPAHLAVRANIGCAKLKGRLELVCRRDGLIGPSISVDKYSTI